MREVNGLDSPPHAARARVADPQGMSGGVEKWIRYEHVVMPLECGDECSEKL